MSITAITPNGHAVYHARLNHPTFYDDGVYLYESKEKVVNGWEARYPVGTIIVIGTAEVVQNKDAVALIIAKAEAKTLDSSTAQKLKRLLRAFNAHTWTWK